MTDLTPMGALGDSPASANFGPLTLTEDTSVTLISLATAPNDPVPDLPGLTLPGPGRLSAGNGIAAFWTGPGQWMIETTTGTDALHRAIAALPGVRMTDQSDGWVVLRATSRQGPAPILALAEKLVNLPPEQLAPGCATRTLLHHLGCFVLRPGPDELAVLTLRSAAGTLWHALAETAARNCTSLPR